MLMFRNEFEWIWVIVTSSNAGFPVYWIILYQMLLVEITPSIKGPDSYIQLNVNGELTDNNKSWEKPEV